MEWLPAALVLLGLLAWKVWRRARQVPFTLNVPEDHGLQYGEIISLDGFGDRRYRGKAKVLLMTKTTITVVRVRRWFS